MNQLIKSIRQHFKSGEMHIKLIMVNVAFFVIILLISILFKFYNPNFNLENYYWISSDFFTVLTKPWTLITYMFGHMTNGIGHIFWNMLILYFSGSLFIQKLGNRKLLSVYLTGGFSGFLLFSIGYNFLPAFQGVGILVGASASVIAILVSIGVYIPNFEIKIPFVSQPIKLIYIVGIFVLLDLIRLQSSIGIDDSNSGGWMAHLGGMIFGAFYGSRLNSGKNILSGFERFLDVIFSGSFLSLFKTKKSPKLKIKKGGKSQNETPSSVSKESIKKIDIEPILRKVKQSGYSSLTAKEKELFFSQTNRK